MTIYDDIKKRIENSANNEVFTIKDFVDIAKPKTISKYLTRLAKEGIICKVMQGIH